MTIMRDAPSRKTRFSERIQRGPKWYKISGGADGSWDIQYKLYTLRCNGKTGELGSPKATKTARMYLKVRYESMKV